jgi:phospholipase/carboxylesterase
MKSPHANQPLLQIVPQGVDAHAAMLMLHGHGANARDILALVDELEQPNFNYFAPQASRNTWIPDGFLVTQKSRQMWFSSALEAVEKSLQKIGEMGIPPERTILLGFSQGASVALEYTIRNPRRYGGLVGLSGGLISQSGMSREFPGSLDGTPVFLGCGETDPYFPRERALESAQVFEKMGGEVTARFYPIGHVVNQDEVHFIRQMMAEVLKAGK